MPACLPACLSACLPACLPVCLSACLSVCLSVCPQETTRIPLNGFSLNLIFEDFSKICPENSSFIKHDEITGTLNEDYGNISLNSS
jgi:hypothetical protein